MNLRQFANTLDISDGYNPYLDHDYDFQDFDSIVEDELGYSVADSPNTKWKKLQKFPWRFERIKDKKKAWANRKGFDELVNTKRFKFLGFDASLATAQQKTQWKELSALLAKLGPAPAPTQAPAPKPVSPIGQNPDTRWNATKKFPYVNSRISDGRKVWANKKGSTWLRNKYPGKFKWVKFDANLATQAQKDQWAKDLKAASQLLPAQPKPPTKPPTKAPTKPPAKPPTKAPTQPLAIPHPDTRWLKTPGYPWVMKRISDNKGIHAGKAGFDHLVKTKQWKFIRFAAELATPLQKSQWAELSEALKGLAPKPIPIKAPPTMPLLSVEPRGMQQDILDIKRMMQLDELQRQATHEHEQIAATKQFRREVLDKLMRIADAVLAADSPLYRRISKAYSRG
jgi:hypothetical protein